MTQLLTYRFFSKKMISYDLKQHVIYCYIWMLHINWTFYYFTNWIYQEKCETKHDQTTFAGPEYEKLIMISSKKCIWRKAKLPVIDLPNAEKRQEYFKQLLLFPVFFLNDVEQLLV